MPPTAPTQPPPLIAKLGEELPVFCESCGYSLHGAVQVRCPQCDILHFQCPECGHHQPINTLRPLVQRFLGRGRATNLIAWVLLKLLFFAIALWCWGALGYANVEDFAFYYRSGADFRNMMCGVAIFGFFFALAGRMMLLRWRRGWVVGLCTAFFAVAAVCAGAYFATMDRRSTIQYWNNGYSRVMLAWIAFVVIASSTCAWGLWLLAVWLLLPRRIGNALLEWQRSMSKPQTPADAPALFK